MKAAPDTKPHSGPAGIPRAPSVAQFSQYPASWYLFCRTGDLRRGPLTKRLLGRDLIAFRTASGKTAVLNARCAHLGADLGRGEVVGEAIRCPFHHWRFDCSGRCEDIPGAVEIPAFARQQSYPVTVRHGFVFFFLGSTALFPLPFFTGDSPEDFAASRPFSFVAEASWFMMAAQGFDTQHFEAVHDRRLLRPPEVDSPSPFARRNRYHAEIVGDSLADRILRLICGPNVTVTITNWGGTVFAVKAEFANACSRFLVCYRPQEDEHTFCEVITFARRGTGRLGLPLRRWFTRAHLLAEAHQVRGTEYRPGRFITADIDMIRCFQWLAALPQELPVEKPSAAQTSITADTDPNS